MRGLEQRIKSLEDRSGKGDGIRLEAMTVGANKYCNYFCEVYRKIRDEDIRKSIEEDIVRHFPLREKECEGCKFKRQLVAMKSKVTDRLSLKETTADLYLRLKDALKEESNENLQKFIEDEMRSLEKDHFFDKEAVNKN